MHELLNIVAIKHATKLIREGLIDFSPVILKYGIRALLTWCSTSIEQNVKYMMRNRHFCCSFGSNVKSVLWSMNQRK